MIGSNVGMKLGATDGSTEGRFDGENVGNVVGTFVGVKILGSEVGLDAHTLEEEKCHVKLKQLFNLQHEKNAIS